MESNYRYQLTKKAIDDLDDIVDYIAVELSNPQAASTFANTLQNAIEEARSFPESGSKVINEYLPDIDVRKKIINNYIMYYLPDHNEKIIQVLRIIYGRRDMNDFFQKLDI